MSSTTGSTIYNKSLLSKITQATRSQHTHPAIGCYNTHTPCRPLHGGPGHGPQRTYTSPASLQMNTSSRLPTTIPLAPTSSTPRSQNALRNNLFRSQKRMKRGTPPTAPDYNAIDAPTEAILNERMPDRASRPVTILTLNRAPAENMNGKRL